MGRRHGVSSWDLGPSSPLPILPQLSQTFSLEHVQNFTQRSARQVAISWMSEGVVGILDELPRSVGEVLGMNRTSQLAAYAEAAGEFWVAAIRWRVAALIEEKSSGRTPALYIATQKVVACLAEYREQLRQPVELELQSTHTDRLELAAVIKICQWDPEMIDQYSANLLRLSKSTVAPEDPLLHLQSIFILEACPGWFGGDPAAFGRANYKLYRHCIATAHSDGMSTQEARLWLCLSATKPVSWSHTEIWQDESGNAILTTDWTAVFGEGGKYLQQASDGYSYDLHHEIMTESCSCDVIPYGLCECLLLQHWGDLETAQAGLRKMDAAVRRVYDDGKGSPASNALMIEHACFWCVPPLPLSLFRGCWQ